MASPSASPRLRALLPWGLLFLAAVVPYLRLLGGELVGDGRALVRGHETLRTATRDPAALGRLFAEDYWDGLAPAAGLYRPLTTGLLGVLYGVAGETAWPYRAFALLLHAGLALAAFALARRLLPPGPALGAAALFAVHPVHAEAVGDVANVGEMLAAFLSLAVLLRILRREGRPGAGALLGDGGIAFAALLAKESAASTILVAGLAMAMLPRGGAGEGKRRWISLLPLAAALIANLAVRWEALGFLSPHYLPTNRIENPLIFEPADLRAATALRILVHGLGLLVFPLRLSADYSLETFRISRSALEPAVLGSALLLLGLAAAALRIRWKNPVAAFAGLACLASFAPTSNLLFPAGTIFAERHLLVPSLYFAVAAFALLPALFASAPAAGRVVAAGLLLLFAARSAARAEEWRSAKALTEVTARRDSPRSVRLLYNLAAERRKDGDRAASKAALEKALAIHPDFFQARTHLGLDEIALGNAERGIAVLRRALREGLGSFPDGSSLWDEAAFRFTDTLARGLARPADAIEYWRGLRVEFPESPDVRIELAHALDLGRVEGAEAELREAARVRTGARILLSERLQEGRRSAEALEVLRAPLPPRTGRDAAAQVAFAEGQRLLESARHVEAEEAFARAAYLASALPIRASARAGLALARLDRDPSPEGLRRAMDEAERAARDPDLPPPLRDELLKILRDARSDTPGR